MLSFKFKDTGNNILTLENPMYVVINQDEKIPADDLTVTFSGIISKTELCDVEVYDGDILVFKGIVDEEQRIVNEKLLYTKITARSMAAMLLDNESKPIDYTNPSTSVIFSRHLLPDSIESYRGDEVTLRERFNVTKGMTDWQVFYSFALKAYNKTPRINADGTADFNGIHSDETLVFSEKNGIRYSSLKENNKRCKLISDVYVKTKTNGGYDSSISRNSIKKRKINRRRYVDASVNTDFLIADNIINNSVDNSYELTLITDKRILNKLGTGVTVEDNYLGEIAGLYISSIYYKLTPDKEETTLILKGERKYVDS